MTLPARNLPQAFDAAQLAALPGARHAWLAQLRSEAGAAFAQSGFPTLKLEDWKFTNLSALAATRFQSFAANDALAPALLAPFIVAPDAHVMVFIGGRFNAALSRLDRLPDGVRIEPLAAGLEAGDAALAPQLGPVASDRAGSVVALNGALVTDGALIRIGANVRLLAPIEILMLSGEGDLAAAHPRHVIVLDRGAEATVIESYAARPGASPTQVYWTNVVSRIELAEGATLRHCKLQTEGPAAYHLGYCEAHLAAKAKYESFLFSLGAGLARNETEVRVKGDDGICRLDSLGLMQGAQLGDVTTRILHLGLRGSSSQLAKNVVAEQGRAVFQGRIRVAPGAQKTDARQLNNNLLLSQGAGADAKPELEILADDVKCSHGATVGDLGPEGLFYLRARGLDETSARMLLVEGFAGAALEAIADEKIRGHFARLLRGWLNELRI